MFPPFPLVTIARFFLFLVGWTRWDLGIAFMKMAQVTRHLSPYEQQIVMPWLRTFPKRAYEKFMGSFVYWGGAAVLTLGTASLSDAADAAQDREHRF